MRHGSAQQLSHAGIEYRRLGESLPYRGPESFPPAQQLRTNQLAILVGVELEVCLAARPERGPPACVPSGPHRVRVAHPEQKVLRRVIGEELVEVLGLQVLALQPIDRGGGELFQRAQHRMPGGRIPCDVETESPVPGDEKRFHGPVLAILLRPANSPILQLDQGLEAVRALLYRSKLLPAHARQIDDGCCAFR